jgi:RNA polymerase sigma factor (sigma-70 family)
MTDWQLIRKFVDERSQAAFAELLKRYTDMVYSACARELGNSPLAEDAAQAVFLILARKAPTLSQGARAATISGWLFQTAILTSRNVRRQETRRHAREQEAAQMRYSQPNTALEWADVEPLLNEAMRALPSGQRDLILERYFRDRPLAEIGADFGISENAARMRINRALERMRRYFAARNIALSTTALAAILPQAVRPSPARCAEAIQQLALSYSDVSVTTSNIYAIALGVIKSMKRRQFQLAAVALVGAFSIGTAGAVRVSNQNKTNAAIAAKKQSHDRAMDILDRMYATYAAMRSFKINVTSREDPLGTAQDGVYEIERPNKIRFHRITLLGPDMSGEASAVADGHNLYVTCTENKGLSNVYAKLPLNNSDNSSWFSDFGNIPAWGNEPYAGMPAAALGWRIDKMFSPQFSAPEYSLGQPTTIDFPGIALPVSLDVVIVQKHSLSPVGAMKDDPQIITYYIGQQDHLLYKVTAAYMIGPNQWDTRTETYNDIQVNPKLAPEDFIFKPQTGSQEVDRTDKLFPDRRI